jgi:hypothetical protein
MGTGSLLCWKLSLIKNNMPRKIDFMGERIQAAVPFVAVTKKNTLFGPEF